MYHVVFIIVQINEVPPVMGVATWYMPNTLQLLQPLKYLATELSFSVEACAMDKVFTTFSEAIWLAN